MEQSSRVGLSGDSAFHSSFPRTWLPTLLSLGSETDVQYCIWLDVQSCSHGSREAPSGPQRMLVITPRKKLPNLPFPREAVGRKKPAFFDIEKEETGQSNISMHTRKQLMPEVLHVQLCFTPFGGFGLLRRYLPHQIFSILLLSLSFSSMVLPSLQGVCLHFLGSPDTLAGGKSWTCSLFPYRNFLFPKNFLFLFQKTSTEMFLQPELPSIPRATCIPSGDSDPSCTHQRMNAQSPVRSPERGSCIQQSCLTLVQILLFLFWDSTGL